MSELLRLSDAAKSLGVTTQTLRNWDAEGKLNTVRTQGNQRRIPESEVIRLLGVDKISKVGTNICPNCGSMYNLNIADSATMELCSIPTMNGVDFKHKIEADGSVSLEYYRFADMATGEVACEMVDGKLVWHKEPENDFVYDAVTYRFEEIMKDWFIEYYGIRETHSFPAVDLEEWLRMGEENDF